MHVADLLAIEASYVGTAESPPGSNNTTFGQEMGCDPAAWCMEFQSHCLRQASYVMPDDAQFPNLGWASVGFFLEYARAHGWVVADPRPGDHVCFVWERGGTWPDHVGIIDDVYADGSLYTIEGNSADCLNPIPGVGDQVGYHRRPRDWTVLAFVRVPGFDPINASNNNPATPVTPRVIAPYPGLPNNVILTVNSPHHDYVHIYQAQMAKRGWSISVDGAFGPQTESITKQFQAEKKLSVDGEVGPITYNAAFELPVT